MKLKILLPLFIFVILSSLTFAQLNANPLGLWRFEDNTSSTVPDSSSNNNFGNLIVDAGYSSSKLTNETGNNSLILDGTIGHVSVNDIVDNDFNFGNSVTDSPFSVGAWVYMNDATGFRVVSKRATNTEIEWSFFTDNSDKLQFSLADSDNSFSIARVTAVLTSLENQWTYLVATYDGAGSPAGINIYVDGVISDIVDNNFGSYVAMHDENINLTIGALNIASTGDGRLDEVFVIDSELSQEQVNQAMNNGWNLTAPSVPLDSEINITLLTPPDSSSSISGIVSFSYFVNITGNSSLFYSTSLDPTVINPQNLLNVNGINNFSSVVFLENQTVTWFVNHTFNSQSSKSADFSFIVSIPPPVVIEELLLVGVCPLVTVQGTLMMGLFFAVGFGLLLIGLVWIPVVGVLGSMLLFVLSFFIFACSVIVGLSLLVTSLVLFAVVIARGVS